MQKALFIESALETKFHDFDFMGVDRRKVAFDFLNLIHGLSIHAFAMSEYRDD